MNSLQQKKIVIGITGGIACYKMVEVVSRLRKLGAEVHVIMTESATHFVTPLTFQEISQNPVTVSLWSDVKHWNVEHIALATLADLFVIAPATANVIGKISHGIADDMLTTTVMATKAPILVVPAMNTQMYLNPITQQNLDYLGRLGYFIMDPDYGRMACGTEGPGRLPEPAKIVDKIVDLFERKQDWLGRKVLVTAGGTREAIDPVRYVGNRSSGKMGYAIAEAAAERGAEVVLVSAPTALPCPKNVTLIPIESALEMRQAVLDYYSSVQVVFKAAAVADFRPSQTFDRKIKKREGDFTLSLEKNPDILRELGSTKKHQILVGFAAETHNVEDYARKKMTEKNLDFIVANDVTQSGAGFNSDTNIVKVIDKSGQIEAWQKMSKKQVAHALLDKIDKVITIST